MSQEGKTLINRWTWLALGERIRRLQFDWERQDRELADALAGLDFHERDEAQETVK